MSALDPRVKDQLEREQRQPKIVGAQPAKNVVFRVYDPPRPLYEGELYTLPPDAVAAIGEPAIRYRDFQIQKVDFQADGTMVLHSLVKLGETPDLRPEARLGDKFESWMELIAAVIRPDGHIRAESIVLGPEPPEQAGERIN